MGDGGIGLARRDFDALIAGRQGGGATAGAAQSAIGIRGPGRGPAPAAKGAVDGGGFYALRGVYFKREQFSSDAECLTAAHRERLPLEMCR
jgi:hypothetical protein